MSYDALKINKTSLNTSRSYIKFETIGRGPKRKNFCKDATVTRLAELFNDQGPNAQWVMWYLKQTEHAAMTGEYVQMYKKVEGPNRSLKSRFIEFLQAKLKKTIFAGLIDNFSESKKEVIVTEPSFWWAKVANLKSEDQRIEFEKELLLDLVKTWNYLVKNKYKKIYIARESDGTLLVSSMLPDECE